MSKDRFFVGLIIMLMLMIVPVTLAQTTSLPWFTMDGGGGLSQDSRFSVVGSIGQWDASTAASNGQYQLQGGLWGVALHSTPFPDVLAPVGSIILPVNNSRLETNSVEFTAEATDNVGGSGVDRVVFYVYYNGQEHNIGTDTTVPYSVTWQKPADLRSQRINFRVQFFDKAGNTAYSIINGMNYIEAVVVSNVKENWIPEERRAYLNQRSLSPSPNNMCGTASSAMSLAMENVIGRDYNSMANKAKAIYRYNNPLPWVTQQLRNNRVTSNYHCEGPDRAWDIIKLHINSGNPVIILNNRFIFGHYFVGVGYREQDSNRQLIVYDPYGRWRGSRNNYDVNSNSPDSQVGKWVLYDFNAVWGYNSSDCPGVTNGYLVTVDSGKRLAPTQEFDGIPTSPPDYISHEVAEIGVYEGIDVLVDDIIKSTYLPLLTK